MFLLTCITGPMRSGKSKLLIEHLERARLQDYETRAYQPDTNTREAGIRSRSGLEFGSQKISQDLRGLDLEWAMSGKTSVIGLDEAMFFDRNSLRELVLDLASRCNDGTQGRAPKIWLIVSGLDLDSDGRPWLQHEELCRAVANRGWPTESIVLKAICEVCAQPASMTFCLVKKTQRVLVGDKQFSTRCVSCWSFGELSR